MDTFARTWNQYGIIGVWMSIDQKYNFLKNVISVEIRFFPEYIEWIKFPKVFQILFLVTTKMLCPLLKAMLFGWTKSKYSVKANFSCINIDNQLIYLLCATYLFFVNGRINPAPQGDLQYCRISFSPYSTSSASGSLSSFPLLLVVSPPVSNCTGYTDSREISA